MNQLIRQNTGRHNKVIYYEKFAKNGGTLKKTIPC